MHTATIILLVILLVLVIVLAVLYFFGKRVQKKQAEQQAMIDSMKQVVPILVIDKKRMKIKESGLPQAVIDQTPKVLRGSKLPIVKAKVGPQIINFIADEKFFQSAMKKNFYRQHRTEIVVQMHSQIFRQIVHKFRRHTDVCQGICVQDAGKYTSRCATKPSGGLCAVVP